MRNVATRNGVNGSYGVFALYGTHSVCAGRGSFRSVVPRRSVEGSKDLPEECHRAGMAAWTRCLWGGRCATEKNSAKRLLVTGTCRKHPSRGIILGKLAAG